MKHFQKFFRTSVSSSAGFSFVEFMVALVFIMILGGMTTRFALDMESQKVLELRKAREGVMLLKSALGAYVMDLAKPPPNMKEGGLEALVKAGYLEEVPRDPWGKAYQYDVPGVQSGRGYDLYSFGPDGVESEDDIADWNLYGQVYRGTSRIAKKRDLALRQYDPKEKK